MKKKNASLWLDCCISGNTNKTFLLAWCSMVAWFRFVLAKLVGASLLLFNKV